MGQELGFLRKLLGDPLKIKNWPEAEQAWHGREIEMPDESSKVNQISEMGFLSKLLNPDAYARTSPFGTIELNRALIDKDKQDLGDWGFAAMTYIGFYAVSPSKRLYLYRELAFQKTKIAEWGPVIKYWIDKEEPVLVKFCKSAGQDRGQEHTIQEQISTELGRPIELSNNSPGSRVAGKMLLHEYLRWKEKPLPPASEARTYDEEYAMWLLRNKGLDDYKSYLISFNKPEPETNLPKLQIFRCDESEHVGHPNCCPLMISSIQSCSYDKKQKGDKPAEDVAEFDGDDPYDDIRYACDAAENYFVLAEEEFKKVQKQQELLEILNKTQDWTPFYRNMRAIEAQNQFKPIQRYKH